MQCVCGLEHLCLHPGDAMALALNHAHSLSHQIAQADRVRLVSCNRGRVLDCHAKLSIGAVVDNLRQAPRQCPVLKVQALGLPGGNLDEVRSSHCLRCRGWRLLRFLGALYADYLAQALQGLEHQPVLLQRLTIKSCQLVCDGDTLAAQA